jgi:hypothetical protein
MYGNIQSLEKSKHNKNQSTIPLGTPNGTKSGICEYIKWFFAGRTKVSTIKGAVRK